MSVLQFTTGHSRALAAGSRVPVCRRQHINHARCRSGRLNVQAFKETDEIKDWRIKDMVSKTHTFFDAVWSKGHVAEADALLDPSFVHRDLCGGWARSYGDGAGGATGVVVGPAAFKSLVQEVHRQYPDYWVEVQQVAVSDTNQLFVLWTSHGTQLEAPNDRVHTASYHNQLVSGVDLIRFNADRSRILEVNVFRQLSSEERHDVEGRSSHRDPLELKLARLHWEPAAAAADAATHNGGGSSGRRH